ncbi:hypothetical protein ACHWQZ_G002968 [Mnemiopsis leidyi]
MTSLETSSNHPFPYKLEITTFSENILTFTDHSPNSGNAFDDKATSMTLAFVCFLLGGSALVLNPFIVGFYSSKARSVVPALYLAVASSDFITGISSIHCGVYLLLKVLDVSGDISKVRLIWSVFFIASLSIRVSAVYTPVLSIVRSINIARPFHRVSVKGVMAVIVTVPLVWTVFLGLDVWTLSKKVVDKNAKYEAGMLQNCFFTFGAGTITILTSADSKLKVYTVLFLWQLLPFFLPGLVTFACMIHQIYTLAANKKTGPNSNNTLRSQNEITVSIALITATFFVCNSLSLIPIFDAFYSVSGSTKQQEIVRFVFTYIPPALNSAINPLILILRGAALRKSVFKTLTRRFVPVLPQSLRMNLVSGRSTRTSVATKMSSSTAALSLQT